MDHDGAPVTGSGADPAAGPTVGPAAELLDRLVAWIDRDHPRVGRFLLGLRWGGLRTVELPPLAWGALLGGTGALGAAGARRVRVVGRVPVPAAVAAPAAAGAAWVALWRWDAARWRAGHVRLVPGLPPDQVRELAERLGAEGVPVEVWERSGAGGAVIGLECRTRDLRRVNREVGELRSPG